MMMRRPEFLMMRRPCAAPRRPKNPGRTVPTILLIWQHQILPFSVSKKIAARIFRSRITGIATNPGEKAIRKTWFWVMSIDKFLTYSIF
jgi:hypothetical protein